MVTEEIQDARKAAALKDGCFGRQEKKIAQKGEDKKGAVNTRGKKEVL